jgi:hypothetical protein
VANRAKRLLPLDRAKKKADAARANNAALITTSFTVAEKKVQSNAVKTKAKAIKQKYLRLNSSIAIHLLFLPKYYHICDKMSI